LAISALLRTAAQIRSRYRNPPLCAPAAHEIVAGNASLAIPLFLNIEPDPIAQEASATSEAIAQIGASQKALPLWLGIPYAFKRVGDAATSARAKGETSFGWWRLLNKRAAS
jgi:hypothetical protein